ncbi:MAG TPA: hypothetical protein VKY59_08480 [Spirillospora sp.]|nr:hypothetical protein [Spirillospora sp.]
MMKRLVFGLTISFTVLILLIRAQPYNGSTVQALLLPQDCRAPCFQGLQPGQTGLNEALQYFSEQPQLQYFIQRSDPPSRELAVLHWREANTGLSGSLIFAGGRLEEITLSGLRLHEIWLALGEPDGGQMVTEMIYLDRQRFLLMPRVHMGYYLANNFRINISPACGWFWQQRVYIVFSKTAVPDDLNPEQTLARQRRATCENERLFLRASMGG